MNKKLRIEWHPLALDDLNDYEARGEIKWSREVALKNRDTLIEAAKSLTTGVLAHREIKSFAGVYGYYIPRTSFWIYYQIENETLKVLRYWHTSRDKVTRSDFDFSEP